MSTVKVWNDSMHDYAENFKGNDIYIKGQDFVKMSRSDAVTFLGTYTSPRRDGVGRSLNEKRLRIEFDHEADAKQKDQPIKHTCDVTNKQFRTDIGFELHLEELGQIKNEGTNDKKNTGRKPSGRGKQLIL